MKHNAWGRTAGIWLTLVSLASAISWAQVTVVDDDFNNGVIATNTDGTGNGWNAGTFNGGQTPQESDGAFVGAMGTEQGISAIQGKDIFPVWNADGTTVTWTIKSMTVSTPHKYNMYFAYLWEMGIVSSANSNAGTAWNMAGVNRNGGFYVCIGKKDNSNAVSMWLNAANKSYSGVEGTDGYIFLDGPEWIASFPIIVTAAFTSSGWQVSTNQSGFAPLSGNWTTSLAADGHTAYITDEFENGVFIWTGARNYGIDGTGNTYPANTGAMERITVVRNAGSTVFEPVVSPDGGTFTGPVEVSLTCGTAGAQIRYTTDGSDPSASSPLYSVPFSLSASATVKARGFKSGMSASPVGSAVFLIVPDSCKAAGTTWQNTSFETQTDTFTAVFTVTPASAPMDGIISLSRGAVFDYPQASAAVRFNASGRIDARNGGEYAADAAVSYAAGTAYRFRVTVNVPAQRYSVYVKPEGGSEVRVASNYAFRTSATQLGMWNTYAAQGNLLVCGFSVPSGSAIHDGYPERHTADFRMQSGHGRVYRMDGLLLPDCSGRSSAGNPGIFIRQQDGAVYKILMLE